MLKLLSHLRSTSCYYCSLCTQVKCQMPDMFLALFSLMLYSVKYYHENHVICSCHVTFSFQVISCSQTNPLLSTLLSHQTIALSVTLNKDFSPLLTSWKDQSAAVWRWPPPQSWFFCRSGIWISPEVNESVSVWSCLLRKHNMCTEVHGVQ